MDADCQLRWIQKNRATYDRARSVGPLFQQLAECVNEEGVLYETASILAHVVDEDFRRYCRIGGLRGATLVIHVGYAAMVHPMQLRWLGKLSEVLRSVRGRIRITRIAFAFGGGGVRIPATGGG